jgi:hypothetical protein
MSKKLTHAQEIALVELTAFFKAYPNDEEKAFDAYRQALGALRLYDSFGRDGVKKMMREAGMTDAEVEEHITECDNILGILLGAHADAEKAGLNPSIFRPRIE